MVSDREQMIEHLAAAAAVAKDPVVVADCLPPPPVGVYIHDCARVLLPLTGEKRIRYAGGGRIRTGNFAPGEALVTPPFGWTVEEWNLPHSMISVVFRTDCLRVIYIEHSGRPPRPAGPQAFYHTRQPAGSVTRLLVTALLASAPESRLRINLLRLLIEAVLEELENDARIPVSRDDLDWIRIAEVMPLVFHSDPGREDIAELTGLHPARISRLIAARQQQSFSAYKNTLKLDQAEILLRQGGLKVCEIAGLCGYRNPNYFIRLFRRRRGMSPDEFRRRSGGVGGTGIAKKR